MPEELVKSALECNRRDAQGTTQVLLADGVRLMALDRHDQGEARFEEALAVAHRTGLMNAYVDRTSLGWPAPSVARSRSRRPMPRASDSAIAPGRQGGATCPAYRPLAAERPSPCPPRVRADRSPARPAAPRLSTASPRAWPWRSGKAPSTSMRKRC